QAFLLWRRFELCRRAQGIVPKGVQVRRAICAVQPSLVAAIISVWKVRTHSRTSMQRLMDIPDQMKNPGEIVRFLGVRIARSQNPSKQRDAILSIGRWNLK